jgi:hypothetical protein
VTAGRCSSFDMTYMEVRLVPLFPRLEAAAVYGPGKRELARVFFAYQAGHPEERIFTLTDSYGRVWIRASDFERVRELVLPPVTGAENPT